MSPETLQLVAGGGLIGFLLALLAGLRRARRETPPDASDLWARSVLRVAASRGSYADSVGVEVLPPIAGRAAWLVRWPGEECWDLCPRGVLVEMLAQHHRGRVADPQRAA